MRARCNVASVPLTGGFLQEGLAFRTVNQRKQGKTASQPKEGSITNQRKQGIQRLGWYARSPPASAAADGALAATVASNLKSVGNGRPAHSAGEALLAGSPLRCSHGVIP